MKKLFFFILLILLALQVDAQERITAANATEKVTVDKGLFKEGDDMNWADPDLDDSSWSEIDVTKVWNEQGYHSNGRSYAWYRIHVNIPKSLLKSTDQQNVVIFNIPKADDVDECFLNGKLIGTTGRMPTDEAGYFAAYREERNYVVDAKDIRWDKDNVVAIRVYNRGNNGGLYDHPFNIFSPNAADGISMNLIDTNVGDYHYDVEICNQYATSTNGKLEIVVTDRETGAVVKSVSKKLNIKRNKPVSVSVPYSMDRKYQLKATYTDGKTGKVITETKQLKYVLTPPTPDVPRFNGAPVFGVRPGSPVIYRFPVSGERPMKFTCSNLPEGLQLTEAEGVLSGKIEKAGNLTFTVTAENAKGKASQEFTLKVGENMIGQTPPMGWNSWNCWGLSISQEKVMASTQALIDKGLADYGYNYINIDDGWEAEERNPDGTIEANDKFPSMKGLVDWLHDRGLKFGIYSSPGPTTCGSYLGSLGHEKQDAEVYNKWGVDYLKYDWCSYEYERRKNNDTGFPSCVRPYLLMQKYLRDQPRDIFYSLGPLGGTQVHLWGLFCDGNSWRTAPDINDTWGSVYHVGFRLQEGKSKYSSVGHWNDPDMLVVGKVGWGTKLHETRLTPDEQYTHITLWTLLASNMLIGCDIAQMDDFTLNLLCNNEVNAINQDMLGKQADLVRKEGDIEIWSRPLADGSIAVGIFNVGNKDHHVSMKALIPAEKPAKVIRDLWRQKDLSSEELECVIPLHGCRYLKVSF